MIQTTPWEGGFSRPVAFVDKFGINASVGGTEETIWLAGGTYDWAGLDAAGAGVVTVSSAAGATDNGVEVTLDGLTDVGGVKTFTQETVTLSGTGTATTVGLFSRNWRAFTSGSQASTGLVTCSIGGVVTATYDAANQQTQQCVYTIPDDQTGFLTRLEPQAGKNDEVAFCIYVREPGGVFRCRANPLAYAGTAGHSYIHNGYHSTTGLRLPPGTDVDIRASKTTAGTANTSATFFLALFAGNISQLYAL